MAKYCAKCGNEITNHKKRYCSFCNADLSDPNNVKERDVDISIRRITEENTTKENTLNSEYDIVDYDVTDEELSVLHTKPKKKWIAFLLQFFLGFTGACFFYEGKWKFALIWIVINIAMGLLYFVLSYFSIFILLGVNMVLSLFILFGKAKDVYGHDLEW